MKDRNILWLCATGVLALLIALGACCTGSDDDDATDDTGADDDDAADDDSADDDTGDDDAADDDDDDDDIPFEPWVNPQARADAFGMFYRERVSRVLLAYNRFMLVNDVVPAHTLGATWIAKAGDEYDVHLHPKDNNEIGTSAFNTYQAYTVFRTRELALTLIRQFEGLAVAEEISGIPGLTCREWQPGFVVEIDGPAGTVARTKYGDPVDPAQSHSAALEAEIVDAFFADGVFTYRADPSESYFTVEPIIDTDDFAVTYVFEQMPDFLRISNCCSSFMVSKLGTFSGYFWGNHNSRDNFPDYAFGYMAACVAADDQEADADLRASAARACESGRRIGDSVVEYGYNLMTVSEFEPYGEQNLIVAGEIRPDGTDEGPEWLGSMNSCQMSYMAKALSHEGLDSPDETVENPGAYEAIAIKMLFELLGLEPPGIVKTCHHIDDAYAGMTWGQLLDLKLLGIPMWDVFALLLDLMPEQAAPIVRELADATHQPEKSAFALVYYARAPGKGDLLQEARETLYHILEVQRRAAQMLYDWAVDQPVPPQDDIDRALHELHLAATYAHIAGVGDERYDPLGFVEHERHIAGFEAVLQRSDTTPLPLKTDDQIWAEIERELENNEDRPNTYNRYWERFPEPEDMPIRRSGDGYEVVGLDGQFHRIPNISHRWFGGVHLWDALPMCALGTTVLDCGWALLGCERPDLDGSGAVDGEDQALFDAAWESYGPPDPAVCDEANAWCDGADLDRSGALDQQDQDFLTAAQGCWY